MGFDLSKISKKVRFSFEFSFQIDANLKDDEALKALEQYKSTFGADINKKNIKMYVEAYSNRQDISALVRTNPCLRSALSKGKTRKPLTQLFSIENLNLIRTDLALFGVRGIVLLVRYNCRTNRL